MALLASWVAFPVVLSLVAYGAGELVMLASGRPLPLGVRLPSGVALVIAVMDLFTRTTATAPLAVAAAVVLGVAGLAAAIYARMRDREDGRPPWTRPHVPAGVLAAVAVFAVYAAPIVLSGEATWAGYAKLDDTSNWLALVTQALSHGRTLSGVAPSAYYGVLSDYLVTGYPIGAFLPIGIGHALLGQDGAWLTDPWMAFLAAMLALTLGYAARRALPRAPAWQPAVIGAIAALSALLYGYYLWGGTKELADALLIATFAVSLPIVLEDKADARASVPALVAVWALVAAESPGGLVWILPGGVVALGLLAWRGRLPSRSAHAEPPDAPTPPARPDKARTGGAPARAARTTPASKPAKAKAGGSPARAARPTRGRGGPIPSLATTRRRNAPPGRRARRGGPAPWRAWLDDAVARFAAVRGARGWLAGAGPATRRLAVVVAVAAAVGLLLVVLPGGWVHTFRDVLTAGGTLGVANLGRPLNPLQVVGIWPSDDFRATASPLGLTYVLIAVALLGAAFGLVMAVRRRRLELVLYVACALTGAILAVVFASAWIGGKALAAASPAVPFAALVGAVVLARRRRLAGAALAVAVVGGVLWSDALAYRDVWLAPRAQFAELAQIDRRVAGQGPTLVTDPESFAVRYFLRDAQADSPGDINARTDPLANGQAVAPGAYADLDQLDLGPVLAYRTIVLRRSPAASRPPYVYSLIDSGRYWQVWQRPPITTSPIITYIPLGTTVTPGSVPACSDVMRLARVAGVRRLVAPPVQNPIVVATGTGTHPRGWSDRTGGGNYLALAGPGTARIPVVVPTAGRYEVWLGGSVRALTSAAVDGRAVGSVRDDIERNGQYVDFGAVTLSAGPHVVSLTRPGGQLLDPGSGGPATVVGPLSLQPDVPAAPPLSVAPSAAGTLCGRTLDWIEALSA